MSDKLVAAQKTIKAGLTSISLPVVLRNLSTGAMETGIAAGSVTGSYWRQGGSRVAITVAALGSLTAAYSSGGWFEVDSTNMPGIYRFDIPDAALATGADWVMIGAKTTNSFHNDLIAIPTLADLRDTIFAKIVEADGSFTAQQVLSTLMSVIAGVTSNNGTTTKTPSGTNTRVAATIDSQNNRTAMTVTPSS